MIRFFVSSTFRDMHEERRRLHALVLPKIREYAADNLGEFVDICDLRWGVDLGGAHDKSDRTNLLVATCLDAIDDCNGFLICFLGDEYGTKLDEDGAGILQSVWEGKALKSLDDYRVSLTQMELEYGVFQGKAGKYCCFKRVFSDESYDSARPKGAREHADLQKGLVNRIKDHCETAYFEYSATWDAEKDVSKPAPGFEDMLFDAMKSIVDNHAQAQQYSNWVEHEWLAARALVENLNDSFAGRGEQIDEFDNCLKQQHFAAIYGESGIGKSAFLAHWFCKNEWLYQPACCYIACGKGSRSKTMLDVAIQLIYFLKNTIDSWPDKRVKPDAIVSEKLAVKQMYHLMGVCDQTLGRRNEKALIVLDAVDQLTQIDGENDFRWLLGQQFEHLNIVVSSIERLDGASTPDTSAGSMSGISDRHFEIKPLTSTDIEDIIEHEMHLSGPDVTKSLIKPLMAKADHAKPLYVRGVIDVLKMGLGQLAPTEDKTVFDLHRETIESLGNTVDELVWQIFKRSADYTGSSIIRSMHAIEADYQRYLGLLATSSHGLADEDAREVLAAENDPWNESRKDAFKALIDYCRLFLSSFFRCDHDGRWMFGHNLVRSSIEGHLDPVASNHAFCAYGNKYADSQEITEAQRTLLFCDVAHAAFELSELELFARLVNRANKLELEDKNAIRAENDIQRRNNISMRTSPSGLVAQTLNDFVKERTPKRYRTLMHAYPSALEQLLTNALTPSAKHIDSKRRISAIKPAAIFVEDRCRDNVPTELAFYWLVKQLIDIYDDVSQHQKSLDDIRLAAEFVCTQTLEGHEDYEQWQLICLANIALFCNNKLIKQRVDGMLGQEPSPSRLENVLECDDKELQNLNATSKSLIDWFTREIEGKTHIEGNAKLTERCAAFTNNIGQYFNAIYRVDLGFAYRMRALIIKVTAAFKPAGLERLLSEYLGLCDQNAPLTAEAHENLACRHVQYWQRFKEYLANLTEQESRCIARYWESIATTYRSLASDYFYWPKLKHAADNNLHWYHTGCLYFELAISLMDEYDFEVNQKEFAVTRIRLVGMKAEELSCHSQIDPRCIEYDFDNLISAIGEACDAYGNHAHFDRREGEFLHKDISRIASILEESAKSTGCVLDTNTIARLEELRATVEIYIGK